MDQVGWVPLNSGEPTFASYRTGALSAPDLAACGASLSRRATWLLGPDLGGDHLPIECLSDKWLHPGGRAQNLESVGRQMAHIDDSKTSIAKQWGYKKLT